jgi:IS5 family transposase
MKTQVVVDKQTKQIICTAQSKGRVHDFRMFKESKTRLRAEIQLLADSGYQGIQKLHSNTLKPIKGSKKKRLSKQDKRYNHTVSSQRMLVEHVIRELKIFKILAAPYRNRRKRFGLRVNLIASFYNLKL